MFATKSIVTLFFAVAAISASPTPTTGNDLPTSVTLTGVTHSVVAGRAGPHFDPDNIFAEIGDVVEWHFLPKNHSVAQSYFTDPCAPKSETSFFSGFHPVAEGRAPDVFQIVITDYETIWFYCPQTDDTYGDHCRAGMVGVINENWNSLWTIATFKNAAASTDTSVIPPVIQGGRVIPNPNPLGGY
ncbi:plastocyanin-like domain-containing protein [Xylogone sp. PMI_703]|nr:plastocyanin-like domain-containing protein [Xylogone sp. PMI_703]